MLNNRFIANAVSERGAGAVRPSKLSIRTS
jgi:hypothetical protein